MTVLEFEDTTRIGAWGGLLQALGRRDDRAKRPAAVAGATPLPPMSRMIPLEPACRWRRRRAPSGWWWCHRPPAAGALVGVGAAAAAASTVTSTVAFGPVLVIVNAHGDRVGHLGLLHRGSGMLPGLANCFAALRGLP